MSRKLQRRELPSLLFVHNFLDSVSPFLVWSDSFFLLWASINNKKLTKKQNVNFSSSKSFWNYFNNFFSYSDELNIAAWVKYQGRDPGIKASRSLMTFTPAPVWFSSLLKAKIFVLFWLPWKAARRICLSVTSFAFLPQLWMWEIAKLPIQPITDHTIEYPLNGAFNMNPELAGFLHIIECRREIRRSALFCFCTVDNNGCCQFWSQNWECKLQIGCTSQLQHPENEKLNLALSLKGKN